MALDQNGPPDRDKDVAPSEKPISLRTDLVIRDKDAAEAAEAASAHRVSELRSGSLSFQEARSFQEAWLSEDVTGPIEKALIHLSPHYVEKATRLFSAIQFEPARERLVGMLNRVALMNAHAPKDDKLQLDRQIRSPNAFYQLDPGPRLDMFLNLSVCGLSEFEALVNGLDLKHTKPDWCEYLALRCMPLLMTFSPAERAKACICLLHVDPENVGAQVILASCWGSFDEIVDKIRQGLLTKKTRRGSDDAVATAVLCGIPEISVAAFEQYLNIGDQNEVATAMLGLMPYLPRQDEQDASFRGSVAIRPELAVFADMLSDLSSAIEAGALTEMVEAAIKVQSEWWVVEALTLTGRRVGTTEEFSAILQASRRLRNLDLRARIVGRVAGRAADLGFAQFAVDTVQTIELEKIRCDVLCELAIRFASGGASSWAEMAADKIDDLELRSRAFAELTLEFGAQGKHASAAAAALQVSEEKWSRWLNSLAGTSLKLTDKIAPAVDLSNRMNDRRQIDETADDFALLADALSHLVDQKEELPELQNLEYAMMSGNRETVQSALLKIWCPSDPGKPGLLELLSRYPRPVALQRIARLGPLFRFQGGGTLVVGVSNAIRRVTSWWP
jgi:hypothetical protein